MNFLGVNIPPLAVAIGSVIVAFITGLGFGMGSETGKYLVERYLKPKYEKLHSNVNKLHDRVLKPIVKQPIKSKILTKVFTKPKTKTKTKSKK